MSNLTVEEAMTGGGSEKHKKNNSKALVGRVFSEQHKKNLKVAARIREMEKRDAIWDWCHRG